MTSTDRPVPRATYRLQLTKDFTFAQVEAIAPYLASLGISHAYLSPIFRARRGSTHGYDVVEPSEVNPELGGLEGFRRMAGVLRGHGIGIILDIVPNHMGIGGEYNRYWLDVLEWGQESRFAGWFDINWSPSEPTLKGKVLVPFLSVAYGEALESGKLELRFDSETGEFAVWAEGTHKLPVHPPSYGLILGRNSEALMRLGGEFDALAGHAQERASALKERLAKACRLHPELLDDISKIVSTFASEPGRGSLDALVAAQHWRAARYFVAADDINYRRFFVVSDLAAVRIERDEVFDHIHALPFQLVAEGLVDGLRIDHIDGLYDPKAYCLKLREKCPRPIYLVVEKILAPGETLRTDWGVEGTTGYEFGTVATQLLTDPEGERPLTELYYSYTGRTVTVAQEEHEAKLEIMDYEMAAELDGLTARFRAIAAGDRTTADLTRNAIRSALRQYVAAMPIYRTYVDAGPLDPEDAARITQAAAQARDAAPGLDPAVFGFVERVAGAHLDGKCGPLALEAARRLQQYTGPVMAKGLEDTVLYRFNRLIALSDVGAKPDLYTATVAAFHDFNRNRRDEFPHGMLGSSSHDTKRGEDVRSRIAVLTGFPAVWASSVQEWLDLLRKGGAPEVAPSDSYYFFQLLLGAWPAEWPEVGVIEPTALEGFRTRVDGAMLKSLREARLQTNWFSPKTDYEEKVSGFVRAALSPDTPFLDSFRAFEQQIGFAGAQNGLIQATLKLTMPGVPDIYQGAELWEQSMVDPDNRRPVDYDRRRELNQSDPTLDLAQLLPGWRTGQVKLALISRLLAYRADHPSLFATGTYEPIGGSGPDGSRVVAFLRRDSVGAIAVVAALGPWRGTPDARLQDNELLGGGEWYDLLRNREVAPVAAEWDVRELVDDLPMAVLVRM